MLSFIGACVVGHYIAKAIDKGLGDKVEKVCEGIREGFKVAIEVIKSKE